MRRQPRCLAIETLGSRELLTSVSGELAAYGTETQLVESVETGRAESVSDLTVVPPPPLAGIASVLEWVRLHPENYPELPPRNT